MKPTMMPFAFWIALILAFAMLLHPRGVLAQAMAEARNGDVRVTLYKDPCALKDVSNLPNRVVWTEGAKTFQGCWGGAPEMGIVVAYFDDKTIAVFAISQFVRVRSS